MSNRITDIEAYKSEHGSCSLCGCLVNSGTALIRHHDDKSVYTINIDSLEEQEHPAEGFFSNVVLIPMLVDDFSFMNDPEGASSLLARQIRAEEACGFFRPQ